MNRHLGFIGWFLVAALVCVVLLMISPLGGESICIEDPRAAACAKAQLTRGLLVQVYVTSAAAFALSAIVLHMVKSHVTIFGLWGLALGPFLILLFPVLL